MAPEGMSHSVTSQQLALATVSGTAYCQDPRVTCPKQLMMTAMLVWQKFG